MVKSRKPNNHWPWLNTSTTFQLSCLQIKLIYSTHKSFQDLFNSSWFDRDQHLPDTWTWQTLGPGDLPWLWLSTQFIGSWLRDNKITNHPDLKDRIKWLNFIIPTMTVKYQRTMEANEHYSFNLECLESCELFIVDVKMYFCFYVCGRV